VRPEQANEIIIGLTEFSPIRQVADVVTISSMAWEGPKETGKDVAVWVSETGSRAESAGAAYGMERIPVHEMSARKSISFSLAEDSFVNIESLMNAQFIRAFATLEGTAFVSGDGVGKPEGFLVNAATLADATTSGTVDELNADDFSQLLYGNKSDATTGLKEGYHANATWAFHRTTLGEARRLKDGQGQYLWQPGLAAGVPNTILDRPYILATDMPVVATGNESVALGDFRIGYKIIDRIGITVQRVMDSTTMDEGGFRLYARKRTGGQVVVAEAIKLLTIQ
jgi:HK97 family phage major capsid protein